MAQIVTITNPLTGQPAQVDQLEHTAQQIDDAVALAPQLSNPNLLDNWYFGNPVNQRGQSEYAVEGYTIDRWKSGAVSDVVGVVNGAITISMTDLYQIFSQSVESPELYAGKPVTASVLVDSIDANDSYQLVVRTGTASEQYKTTVIKGSGLFSITWKVPDGATLLQVAIQAIKENAGSISIKAIKLELGSQQTLAHQDESGNWVMNEIPDYGEQLGRCQRFQLVFNEAYAPVGFGQAATDGTAKIYVPTPVSLRVSPIVSGNLYLRTGGTFVSVSSVSVEAVSPNFVRLNVAANVTSGTAYESFTDDTKKLILDANL